MRRAVLIFFLLSIILPLQGQVNRIKLDSIYVNFKILMPPGALQDSTVTLADLSQSLIDYIDASGGGSITNNPDGVTIKANPDQTLSVLLINGSHVTDGSLTSADIQDGSLTGTDVQNNSIGIEEMANIDISNDGKIYEIGPLGFPQYHLLRGVSFEQSAKDTVTVLARIVAADTAGQLRNEIAALASSLHDDMIDSAAAVAGDTAAQLRQVVIDSSNAIRADIEPVASAVAGDTATVLRAETKEVVTDSLIDYAIIHGNFEFSNRYGYTSTSVQRAIDSIAVNNDSGGVVIFTPGVYTVTSTIRMKHKMIGMAWNTSGYMASAQMGAGDFTAVILRGDASLTDPIMSFDTTGAPEILGTGSRRVWNGGIIGLQFDGTSMSSITADSGLLALTYCGGFVIRDCQFFNSPGDGLSINYGIAFSVNKCIFSRNAGNNLLIKTVTSDFEISECQVGNAGEYGIYLTGSTAAFRIINNKIFNNSTGALISGSSYSGVISSNDFHEYPGRRIAYLINGYNLTITNNLFWYADTCLYIKNVDNSTFTGNIFSTADYAMLFRISLSTGNSVTGNTFQAITNDGIIGIYNSRNTIYGNIGASSRTDNEINIHNKSDHLINLNQNIWAKIPLDTSNYSTDSLSLNGDSIVVKSNGYYEMKGQFTIVSDSMTTIEIAPAVFDSLRMLSSMSTTLPDSVPMNIGLLFYEFVADTEDVDLWIRNTTNDSDVVIKNAVFSLKQIGLKEPNYVLGAELITNGTFDTDLTGWTNSGPYPFGTFEWSSGALHIVYDGTPPAYQYCGITNTERFSVTEGERYVIKFDLTKNSGTNLTVIIRYCTDCSVVENLGNYTEGSNSITWESPVTSVVSITFNKNATADWDIDNVSVKEILN